MTVQNTEVTHEEINQDGGAKIAKDFKKIDEALVTETTGLEFKEKGEKNKDNNETILKKSNGYIFLNQISQERQKEFFDLFEIRGIKLGNIESNMYKMMHINTSVDGKNFYGSVFCSIDSNGFIFYLPFQEGKATLQTEYNNGQKIIPWNEYLELMGESLDVSLLYQKLMNIQYIATMAKLNNKSLYKQAYSLLKIFKSQGINDIKNIEIKYNDINKTINFKNGNNEGEINYNNYDKDDTLKEENPNRILLNNLNNLP